MFSWCKKKLKKFANKSVVVDWSFSDFTNRPQYALTTIFSFSTNCFLINFFYVGVKRKLQLTFLKFLRRLRKRVFLCCQTCRLYLCFHWTPFPLMLYHLAQETTGDLSPISVVNRIETACFSCFKNTAEQRQQKIQIVNRALSYQLMFCHVGISIGPKYPVTNFITPPLGTKTRNLLSLLRMEVVLFNVSPSNFNDKDS